MTGERMIESAVPAEYADLRLDLYLSKRFSYLSRTAWQREIESGRVLLNGSVMLNVKKKVMKGSVRISPSLQTEEISLFIIFKNDNK
jgi:16S rRNA U516 pseudouridylate synthase RsuA-like enzyme